MATLASPHIPATARPAALAAWLLAVAGLVFAIVVVGGITRLTESGLSITEWKPVTGVLPPLSDAAWEEEFAKYRAVPQYTEINLGMSLAEFQRIWFWEWFHRLIGRLIGVAFAVPLLVFAWMRAIPPGYGPRLLALLALGALQGAIGWWMVQSGLSVRTDVSHLRLAVHLSTALLILAGLVWTALDLSALARHGSARPARLTPLAAAVLAVLAIQIALGALVAGMEAGQVSSTWPLMNGSFVPEGIDWTRGLPFVDDPFLVHFLHRWWAFVAVAALVLLARRARAEGDRAASIALHTAFGAQILLGIATVLLGVPLWLAVLHQAVGALVVASAAWAAHAAGRAC
jgi:cytochrome c oxidase assembly protein subunit 15